MTNPGPDPGVNVMRILKGRWQRKMKGVGMNTVIQLLSGIVAIGVYFKFERAVNL
jgi:hypothetical protein